RREEPWAIIRRCQSKRSRRDHVDFVALILNLLALGAWTLFQNHRAPFADDPVSVLLGPAKTKTAHNAWCAIADGRQCEEGVLRLELFDLLQCPKSFRGLRVIQRLAQKILDRRFPVQPINVRLTPLVACPIKVRHLRQKNCIPRQKLGHRSARNLLGKIPVVPTSVCGNGNRNDQQQNSSHKQRLSARMLRYSMLDTCAKAT